MSDNLSNRSLYLMWGKTNLYYNNWESLFSNMPVLKVKNDTSLSIFEVISKIRKNNRRQETVLPITKIPIIYATWVNSFTTDLIDESWENLLWSSRILADKYKWIIEESIEFSKESAWIINFMILLYILQNELFLTEKTYICIDNLSWVNDERHISEYIEKHIIWSSVLCTDSIYNTHENNKKITNTVKNVIKENWLDWYLNKTINDKLSLEEKITG